MEERVRYCADSLLQEVDNNAMMDAGPPETIQVSRSELEQERRHLLGRLQWLNRKLGYPPLLTGKEQRRQAFAE